MVINLPDDVKFIIDTLESGGFEAYAVGGCVRDSIMGKLPYDWDVCTSALPEQTIETFAGQHIIETGLKHGTVTLMLNGNPYEITTFRTDGKYTDNRRPDKVKFVNVLKRDLARRDFTINSLAYNPKADIIDYYGGVEDLRAGVIKCVGNANKRFQEDALRIMRALRFASVFGFVGDGDTAKAMHENKKLLRNIAVERIAAEFNKLLLGDGARQVLSAHIEIIAEIIPEITSAVGFKQNNPYHCYDVLTHILYGVEAAPKDLILRLALFFHDIGKPASYTESDGGTGHFYGHPQISSDMAYEILQRLRYDNDTIKTVTQLVSFHDCEINRRQHIKRWLNKIGEERFRQLIEVKKADAAAQAMAVRADRINALSGILIMLDEIIAQNQCFSLKDLAVKGRDLIDAGLSEGKQIGVILDKLMDTVINEEAENDKAALLEIAKEQIKEEVQRI